MIPRLFKNGVEILAYIKNGRTNIAYLADGTELLSGSLKNIECVCSVCDRTTTINFRAAILDKVYVCQSCNKKGEKNPFYGKSHTDEFKNNHSELMKGRNVGEKNPFYGRTHSEKTIEILRETCGRSGEDNGFYGKTHTEENRELISQRAINALKNKKYKKTIPEKLTEEQLVKMNIPHTYNKIIQKVGQFDFIISDNILLEVHGDYWHGNPLIYGEDKHPLNERQLYKQSRDTEKKTLAEQIGHRVFYIWEFDIKNENWGILYEIKRLLDEDF